MGHARDARVGLWLLSSLVVTYLLCQLLTLFRYHRGMRAMQARIAATEKVYLGMLRLQLRDFEANPAARAPFSHLQGDEYEYLAGQAFTLAHRGEVSEETVRRFLSVQTAPQTYPQT